MQFAAILVDVADAPKDGFACQAIECFFLPVFDGHPTDGRARLYDLGRDIAGLSGIPIDAARTRTETEMTQALSKLNFRDLGGLPAEGGGVVRYGVIFRNEGPASLSEAHRRELVALDIKMVCDLRAGVERDKAPNDWTTARLVNLDITNDLRAETNEGWSALRDDPSAAGAHKAMRMNYAAIPGALLPHLQLLADAIIAGELPMLIHCTAGKDRTGVLVALFLLLLGVPKEEVVLDYLRSDVFARNLRLGGSITHAFEETFGFTPSEDTIAAMIGVDTDFLDAALDAVTARWGFIEDYFDAAGVDAVKRAALRDALVERG